MAGPVLWQGDSWCIPCQNGLQGVPVGRRTDVGLTCSGEGGYDRVEYTVEFAGLGPLSPVPQGRERYPNVKIRREIRVVGVTGFEPTTSCSQSRRSNQAELHPVSPRMLACPCAEVKDKETSGRSGVLDPPLTNHEQGKSCVGSIPASGKGT